MIKDWISQLADRIKAAYKNLKPESREGRMVSQMKDAIDEIQQLFAEALDDARRNEQAAKERGTAGAEKNTTREGGVRNSTADGRGSENGQKYSATQDGSEKFSIRQIVDDNGKSYGVGVYLDSNMLDGLTEDEQKQMVKEWVCDELAGKTVTAYNQDGTEVEIHIAKRNEKIRNSSGNKRPVLDELYRKNNKREIKREAVILADELIEAPKFDKNAPALYSHDWLDNYGQNDWETRTVYVQQKNKSVWETALKIAKATDGRKILYDIVPKKVAGAEMSAPTTTIDNISQNGTESQEEKHQERKQTTDSEGRELSEGQKEYFRDSVARDDNGSLKVMYHGTSNGGHNMFDPYGKAKYGLFGLGTYFTDNKSVAESYMKKGKGSNPQVYEVYLNITNPIDMDANADPVEWENAFPDAKFPDAGTNEQFYRAMEEYFRDEEFIKWEAEEAAMEGIMSMGYDGITHIGGGRFNKNDETRHRVYIAFESEQIKRTDNLNPTSNPDTRYQQRNRMSAQEARVLQRQNAKLREDLNEAKELLKLQGQVTGGTVMTKSSIDAAAKNLMEKYNASGASKELASMLNDVYSYIAGGKELTIETSRIFRESGG